MGVCAHAHDECLMLMCSEDTVCVHTHTMCVYEGAVCVCTHTMCVYEGAVCVHAHDVCFVTIVLPSLILSGSTVLPGAVRAKDRHPEVPDFRMMYLGRTIYSSFKKGASGGRSACGTSSHTHADAHTHTHTHTLVIGRLGNPFL